MDVAKTYANTQIYIQFRSEWQRTWTYTARMYLFCESLQALHGQGIAASFSKRANATASQLAHETT